MIEVTFNRTAMVR